jgi:hypothetical protein
VKRARKWRPVVREGTAFESRAQEVAVDDARIDNPRREGESLAAWLERINVTAGVMTLSQCAEPVSREPGSDE